MGDIDDKIEFFICKFHTKYDGLFGNNILKKLKAIIDLKDDLFVVGNKKIPMNYTLEDKEYFFETDGVYNVELNINKENGTLDVIF